jgi:hypothetical protein
MPPALFRLPGGLLVPGVGLALIGWLLLNTSWKETRDVLIATAVGALLYVIGRTVQRGGSDGASAAT